MKVNQLKAGVILSYSTIIVQVLITLIYTPIILRMLGRNEYGLYELVYAVITYLSLLSFGFGSSYIRFYARFDAKNDKQGIAGLNTMFLIVFIVIACIGGIIGIITAENMGAIFGKSLTSAEIAKSRILMYIMSANLSMVFISSVFEAFMLAHERYIMQKAILLLQAVLTPFISIPLLFMGLESISLALAAVILSMIRLLAGVLYCLLNLKIQFSRKNINLRLLKEIAGFSAFIFIGMVVDQLNWTVDKFLLGIFGGTAAVAVYAIGSQINGVYLWLCSAMSSVFIPKVNAIVASEKVDSNKKLTLLFTKVGRLQFIVLLLVLLGIIIFGKPFVNLWAGDGYELSYYVALILVIPVTIPLTQSLGVEIQRAKNLHRVSSIIYLLVAVVNVAVSIPLTIFFGVVGAAFGTAFSIIAGNIIVMNWYYQKIVKLDMKYFWVEIIKLLPAGIVSALSGIVVALFLNIDSIIKLLFGVAVFSSVYFIIMYFLGMNSEERGLIKIPLIRIIAKIKR